MTGQNPSTHPSPSLDVERGERGETLDDVYRRESDGVPSGTGTNTPRGRVHGKGLTEGDQGQQIQYTHHHLKLMARYGGYTSKQFFAGHASYRVGSLVADGRRGRLNPGSSSSSPPWTCRYVHSRPLLLNHHELQPTARLFQQPCPQ